MCICNVRRPKTHRILDGFFSFVSSLPFRSVILLVSRSLFHFVSFIFVPTFFVIVHILFASARLPALRFTNVVSACCDRWACDSVAYISWEKGAFDAIMIAVETMRQLAQPTVASMKPRIFSLCSTSAGYARVVRSNSFLRKARVSFGFVWIFFSLLHSSECVFVCFSKIKY